MNDQPNYSEIDETEFRDLDSETQTALDDVLRIIDPNYNPDRFLVICEGGVMKIYEVS